MKRWIAALLALTMLLTLGGFAAAENQDDNEVKPTTNFSFGIGSFSHGEIENTEVEPVGDIDLGTIGTYDAPEIENTEVKPVGDIDLGTIGTYDAPEIENTEVKPVGDIDLGAIGTYDAPEIENTEVKPVTDIDFVTIGAYDAPEIQNVEVTPIDTITFDGIEYKVPEIPNTLPTEVQPFYFSMISHMDGSQLEGLVRLSPIELAEITQRQYDLVNELVKAFSLEGITVQFNRATGMARIDSSLLYATNEYKLTEEGKEIIGKIIRVYAETLSQEKYRDSISRVTIVGHTDTVGSYDYNKQLSQRRADAVKEYCLSGESGVEDVEWLSSVLTAEGHSYDELIYNLDGSENKDASRRVEIGFTVSIN